MNADSHIVRNAAVAIAAVIGLVVLAAIAENGALAVIVTVVILGLAVLFLPLFVIHREEHDERGEGQLGASKRL